MPGEFGTPYRAPCDGWTAARKNYYACPNHFIAAHHRIPVSANTTLVVNNDPCDPPTTPAYPTPRGTDPAFPYETKCFEDNGVGPWPRPHPGNTYAAPQLDLTLLPPLDLAVCRKIGFKNLYGYKVWHGRYGFRSRMEDISPEWAEISSSDGVNFDCFKPQDVDLSIDDTKYLKMDYALSWQDYLTGGPGTSDSGGYTSSETVNRYSGHRTGSSGTTGSALPSFIIGLIDPTAASGFSQNMPFALFNDQVGPRTGIPGVVITTGTILTYDEDLGGGVTTSATLNLATGTYHLETTNITGDYQTVDCVVSNTSYHYIRVIHNVIPGEGGTYTRDQIWEVTATLSNAYTGTQVQADLKDLLAQWNLCDDAQYPFRTDMGVTSGPLVSYNERAPQAPGLWPADDYEDTSSPPRDDVADGAMAGGPLPTGSQPYFDYSHITYRFADGGTSGLIAIPDEWGMSSNGTINPANIGAFYHATQWLDNRVEKHIPPGPFRSLNSIWLVDQFTDDAEPLMFNPSVFWGCDWVEVIIPRLSHNFFRPCGKDVLEHDPATVVCGSNDDGDVRWDVETESWPICGRIGVLSATQDGSNVNIVLASAADYLVTGNHIDFSGVAGLGSNLSVTVTDPTHIVVTGTLDVDHPYTTGGWIKSHGAPSYEWHDDQRKIDYLFKSWVYDFRDFWESYYVKLASYHPTEGCTGPTNPDPVRYIEESPSDESGKDIIGTGSYWLKSLTETALCAARNPCYPAICIVSDNAQNGCKNSTRVTPPALTLDGKYGTFWIGRVEQWMVDPLWKAPGADYISLGCDEGCDLFEEDSVQDPLADYRHMGKEDYTSIGGEVCIYPHHPNVEARKDLPTGAPALPADAKTMGCADWIENQNDDPPTTEPNRTTICAPAYTHYLIFLPTISPGVGGYYQLWSYPDLGLYPMPWITQLAQENTVRAGGRFSAEYQANGVRV